MKKSSYEMELEDAIREGATSIWVNWVKLNLTDEGVGAPGRIEKGLSDARYRPDGFDTTTSSELWRKVW